MSTFQTIRRQLLKRLLVLAVFISFPVFSETIGTFSISSDGREVTDNKTGLVWQRCPIGMYWDATSSTCSGSPNYYMWYEALHVAVNTSRASGVVWRVPNVKELTSIVDRKSVNPAIDSQIFPATPNHNFWSATPYASDAFFAWLVDFYDGQIYYSYLEDMGALRLVRDPIATANSS